MARKRKMVIAKVFVEFPAKVGKTAVKVGRKAGTMAVELSPPSYLTKKRRKKKR